VTVYSAMIPCCECVKTLSTVLALLQNFIVVWCVCSCHVEKMLRTVNQLQECTHFTLGGTYYKHNIITDLMSRCLYFTAFTFTPTLSMSTTVNLRLKIAWNASHPSPSLPFRSRHPQLWLTGLGECSSSPSGSGQSPAAKCILTHFRRKFVPF